MITAPHDGFGRNRTRDGWPAVFGGRIAASRLLSALLLLPLLLACGSDATGPGDDIAGTYALQTVDGMSLPALVLQAGNESVEILNGEILLRANGTFRSSINRRDTVGGTVTTMEQVDEGEWGRTGNALTLFFPDGDRDAATVSGGTLTVESAGFVFVFVRT